MVTRQISIVAIICMFAVSCNQTDKQQESMNERKEFSFNPAIRANNSKMPAITISKVINWFSLV